MKKLIGTLSLIALVVGGLEANGVHLKSGWNLVSTGGVDDLNSSCILKQLPMGSIVWSYKDGNWVAKSNSDSVNTLINDNNISLYNFIGRYDGFWVFNKSTDGVDIEMYCSQQNNGEDQNSSNESSKINFTFGNLVNYTATQILQQGNVFFDVDNYGYEKIVLTSSSESALTWNQYNDGSWTVENEGPLSLSINSDNNISYTVDETGEQGYFIINSAKDVIKVNDINTTYVALKLVDLTGYITVSGSGHWDDSGWQPTYYDSSTNSQVAITDITTLKNQFINPNSSYWFGDEDEGDVYIFEASDDTNITSGNVVKAVQDGYHQDGHKRYVRGSEIVGHWTLSDGVLTAETSTQIKKWRFNNGKLQDLEIDKPGATFHLKWLIGNDPQTIEQTLRSFY